MQSFPIIPVDESCLARRRPVYGVGINDAEYVVHPRLNGKQYHCPFYVRWSNLLQRVYSSSYHIKNPKFIGIKLADEWLIFSKFKRWVSTQDWEGKYFCGDLLVKGNKYYSPENCVFVTRETLSFFYDHNSASNELLLGVSFFKASGKYMAQTVQRGAKSNSLGLFETEIEAHKAWKARKHELALQLAEQQTDERVANALRVRFA